MVFQFKDMMIKEPETELDRFWLSRASTKVIFQFVRLRGFKILKERIQGTGSGPSFRILVRPSPPSSPQGSARAARAARTRRPGRPCRPGRPASGPRFGALCEHELPQMHPNCLELPQNCRPNCHTLHACGQRECNARPRGRWG